MKPFFLVSALSALTCCLAAPAFAQTAAPTYAEGNQIKSAQGTFVIDKSGNPLGTSTNPFDIFDSSTAAIAAAITAPLNAQNGGNPIVWIGSINGKTVAGTADPDPVTIQGNTGGVPVPVTLGANPQAALGTSNGWTAYLANGLTSAVKVVKSTGGQLGALQCYNPNSAQVYVQVFNTTSVTLGTATPLLSIPIAPQSTGGLALANPGINFSAAIAIAATTTATGSTAPSTAADCNVLYN